MSISFFLADENYNLPYPMTVLKSFLNEDQDDETPNPAYVRELDINFTNHNAYAVLDQLGIKYDSNGTDYIPLDDDLVSKIALAVSETYRSGDNDLCRRIIRISDMVQYGLSHNCKFIYGV